MYAEISQIIQHTDQERIIRCKMYLIYVEFRASSARCSERFDNNYREGEQVIVHLPVTMITLFFPTCRRLLETVWQQETLH